MAQDQHHNATDEQVAIFAGGCFWCMEPPFDNAQGVTDTIVGYIGGQASNATYEAVSTGKTGHREAVEIHYNPSQISYEQLLNILWETIDPFDAGGQFVDRGSQYTTAIYYMNDQQHKQAIASKKALEAQSGKKVATEILPSEPFYSAEGYHQNFYQTNEAHYQRYKKGSGR